WVEGGWRMTHGDEGREVDVDAGQDRGERAGLHEGQVVQRRAAARHLLVVVSDVLQPLGRDPPAARDVLKERADLVRLRGAPEGDEKDGLDHCNGCREPGLNRGWRAIGATRLRTAITWRTSRGPCRRA